MEMKKIGFIICPHLKGSMDGSVCRATDSLIKNMEDVEIKLCMSRHHEACSIYIRSLHNMINFGSYSVNQQSMEL
jgi:hypothetical protein